MANTDKRKADLFANTLHSIHQVPEGPSYDIATMVEHVISESQEGAFTPLAEATGRYSQLAEDGPLLREISKPEVLRTLK